MNRAEFVKEIAGKASLEEKVTDVVLDAIMAVVKDTLSKDGEIIIKKFGSFKVKNRAARVSRNPKTGEKINVPSKKVASFKFSKSFID